MKTFNGILGMPFLNNNKAVIFGENNVLNLKSQEIVNKSKTPEPLQHALTAQVQDNLEDLLDQNSEVNINEISKMKPIKMFNAYIKNKVNIPLIPNNL